jgi:hypothetical protein
MKISFEGTMKEFQAVFSGLALFSEDSEEEEESPSGVVRTFPVVNGGKEEASVEAGDAVAETGDRDMVGVNPLANDMPVPENDPSVGKELNLPKLGEEERRLGWDKFREVCVLWTENFGVQEEVEVEKQEALRNEAGDLVDEEGNPIKRVNGRGQVVYKTVKVKEMRPAPQPDRVAALTELGEGRYPRAVLVMAYEIRSLQRMVGKALLEETMEPYLGKPTQEDYLDYIDQIAMNMVQVSHKAFPDLAGTYDYSSRWRRVAPAGA